MKLAKIRKEKEIKKKEMFKKKRLEKEKEQKRLEFIQNKSNKKLGAKGKKFKKIKRSPSPTLEEINKMMKKKMEPKYQARSEMFEYNTRDYKNKNIPFKKVFDKFKPKYHPDKPRRPPQVLKYNNIFKKKKNIIQNITKVKNKS